MTRTNNKNHTSHMIKAIAMSILAMSALAFAGCAYQETVPEANAQAVPMTGNNIAAVQESVEVSAGSSGKKNSPSTNVNDISKLGDLVGNWSLLCMSDYAYVDISSEINPYDLDWRYGPEPDKKLTSNKKRKLVNSDEWDELWESYVDFCDWDLVFDADFYMETFPILAELYDHDEEALLRHYQTVGIHEGRQANEDFNPAAYMANCRTYLQNKLKDDPECYVIYYMTHYKAESKVNTLNDKGEYPVWLNVEISYAQSKELEMINKYREEVKVDPVNPHPELMAYANLRCRIDAIGQYDGHDWLHTKEYKTKNYGKTLGVKYWDENTIKANSGGSVIKTPYMNYRLSESHYEAMVDPEQEYAGTSNFYFSPDWGKVVHFDVYTPSLPNPGNNEMP